LTIDDIAGRRVVGVDLDDETIGRNGADPCSMLSNNSVSGGGRRSARGRSITKKGKTEPRHKDRTMTKKRLASDGKHATISAQGGNEEKDGRG
jgi:hypothetical protein